MLSQSFKRLRISRHVLFDEDRFPYAHPESLIHTNTLQQYVTPVMMNIPLHNPDTSVTAPNSTQDTKVSNEVSTAENTEHSIDQEHSVQLDSLTSNNVESFHDGSPLHTGSINTEIAENHNDTAVNNEEDVHHSTEDAPAADNQGNVNNNALPRTCYSQI
jgi:hypothetical protein